VTTVLFALAAAAVLAGALAAVLARDLVRAVLGLGVTLAGMAGLYGLLEAPYLAAIQLLVYVGGVMTVLVFGVLLTRRPEEDRVVVARGRVLPALVAALAFAVPVAIAVLGTAPPAPPAAAETAASVGARFVGEHILAFEALSAVLLAAMIGAIVLARRSDPGERAAGGKRP
jgi:NADH:ubiquinone oxidoreductase subunit 6 (subunit J)